MSITDQKRPDEADSEGVSRSTRASGHSAGAIAVMMDFVGASLPQVDQLLEAMRLTPSGPGSPGSLFQWSRPTLDGVRISEVWQSWDAFERALADTLNDGLIAAGLPKPELTVYEVHSYPTQGALPPTDESEAEGRTAS